MEKSTSYNINLEYAKANGISYGIEVNKYLNKLDVFFYGTPAQYIALYPNSPYVQNLNAFLSTPRQDNKTFSFKTGKVSDSGNQISSQVIFKVNFKGENYPSEGELVSVHPSK